MSEPLMPTAMCTKCMQVMPTSRFYKRTDRKGALKSWCKNCFSVYRKRQPSEKRRASATKRRKKAKDYILAAKDVPCMDCHKRFPPEAMDFDHVRGEKLYNVGLMTAYAIRTIQAEIDKCDVVCSNCHRIRTYARNEGVGWDAYWKRKRS